MLLVRLTLSLSSNLKKKITQDTLSLLVEHERLEHRDGRADDGHQDANPGNALVKQHLVADGLGVLDLPRGDLLRHGLDEDDGLYMCVCWL